MLVDHFTLIVGDVVVFQQLFADIEVARLHFALSIFDRACHPAMLDGLAFRHFQTLHDRGDAVAGENFQQRIFQRQIKAARTRIALTTGTAPQLIVHAPRFMALGADDVQAAFLDHVIMALLPFAANGRHASIFFIVA